MVDLMNIIQSVSSENYENQEWGAVKPLHYIYEELSKRGDYSMDWLTVELKQLQRVGKVELYFLDTVLVGVNLL